MNRSYSAKTYKLLFGLSGLHCSICREPCWVDNPNGSPTIVAEIAHIRAISQGGPRYDALYPATKLNEYENLILVCKNHHAVIDNQTSTFTVSDLETYKRDHEKWHLDRLEDFVPEVGFAQLEVILDALVDDASAVKESYEIIPPQDKIDKNQLSQKITRLIVMGQMRDHDVASFLTTMSGQSATYSEKLRAAFVEKYLGLKKELASPDAIFFGLVDFCSSGKRDLASQAASLAVVSHLFIACDIFEK